MISCFEAHQVLFLLARPLDVNLEDFGMALRRMLGWLYQQLTPGASSQWSDSVVRELSMLLWRMLDLSFRKANNYYDATVAEHFKAQDSRQRVLTPLNLNDFADGMQMPNQLLAAFKKAPQEWWRNWHLFIGTRLEVCSGGERNHDCFRTIGFVTEELQSNDIILDPYDTANSYPDEDAGTTVSLFLRLHEDGYKVINHGWLRYGILSVHDLTNEVKPFNFAFN
jgi:hypothetical protein